MPQEYSLWDFAAIVMIAGYTPPGLFVLYFLYCQHERSKWLLPLKFVFGVPGFLIDVLANYTWYSLMVWQQPVKGQYTISQRCYYLQAATDWRGRVARLTVRLLNSVSVTPHVKAFKNE